MMDGSTNDSRTPRCCEAGHTAWPDPCPWHPALPEAPEYLQEQPLGSTFTSSRGITYVQNRGGGFQATPAEAPDWERHVRSALAPLGFDPRPRHG